MGIEHLIRYAPRAVGLMEIEHSIRFASRAVGLMEVENLIRYTELAVGLKPLAMQRQSPPARAWRIIYSKTIFHKGSPAASMSDSYVPFPVVSPGRIDTHTQK